MAKINKKTKLVKQKKKKKIGCCGCVGLTLLSIVILFGVTLGAGYFVGNKYLMDNYGISIADCFSLIGSVYKVDESKVITEGVANEEDKIAFYGELSDSTFIKSSSIEDVVATAAAQTLAPSIADALGTSVKEEEAQTEHAPLLAAAQEGEESGFDWEEYLIGLVEDGAIDETKLKAFFDSGKTVADVYDDQFVIDVQGKGVVALTDAILNSALTGVNGTEGLAGKFGIKQLKFEKTDGSDVKVINAVVQVKLREVVEEMLNSSLSNNILGGAAEYKKAISFFKFVIPQNLLVGVNLNLDKESATIDPYLNNISVETVNKWFDVFNKMGLGDLNKQLDDIVNSVWTSLNEQIGDFMDIYSMIENGYLKLDVYDVGAKVINKQMELSGDDALNKTEAAETVANVFYANMDVNGNGRDEILTQNAPKFLAADWKDTAKAGFKNWLIENIAFDGNYSVDDFIASFEDENGNFGMPSSMSDILDYLDTDKMKEQGITFLNNTPLTIDDTFVAYLFEDYKQTFLGSEGMEEYIDKLSLEYVRIDQDGELRPKTYIMLGISILTDDLLELMDFKDMGFITSIIGDQIFVCAKSDITQDAESREESRFMLNGLTETQTATILKTVSKIAKKDIISEFIDTYIVQFVDKLKEVERDYFRVDFAADGQGNGAIVLPSASLMVERILAKTENKEIDGEKLVEALSTMLVSDYSPPSYSSYIRQSSYLLTGSETTYEDYFALLKAELYDDYLMESGDNALTVMEFVDTLTDIKNSSNAMDVILGEGDDKFITFKQAYFQSRNTVADTIPTIDGHTLAYLMNASDAKFTEVLGSIKIDLLDTVDIMDIEFDGGFMYLYLNADMNKLIDMFDEDLGEYKSFITKLFGGEGETMALTIKINVTDHDEDVYVFMSELERERMEVVFDALKAFGVTTFDFEDENNEIRKMANDIAEYIKEECTVDGNKLSLPSIFTVMNDDVIKKENITDEDVFAAVHDYVLSAASSDSYDNADKHAASYEVLNGEAYQGVYDNSDGDYAEYSALVKSSVENKYMLRTDKNIGDMIDAVSKSGQEQSDAFLGTDGDAESGLMQTDRASMAVYFRSTADTYEKTVPYLNPHTLAYVVDNYKDDIKTMASFDGGSTSDLFDNIEILDFKVHTEVDGEGNAVDYLTIYVKTEMDKMFDALGDGGDMQKMFKLFDSANQTVSLAITKPLNAQEGVYVQLNDMTDGELDNLSKLLCAYDIDYFETQNEGNVFEEMATSVVDMINEYMPYKNGLFTFDSAFDYIGKEVATEDGEGLTGEDAYVLVKAFTVYDNVSSVKIEAGTEFDKKTARYYYLDQGTSTVNGIINGTKDENSMMFRNYRIDEDGNRLEGEVAARDIIIEENKNLGSDEKIYDSGFVMQEKYLAGLVDELEMSSMDEKYVLDQISVNSYNYITAYAVVEVKSFFSTEKLGNLERFDVLPNQLKVSIPVSFNDVGEEDAWTITDMEDADNVKRILLRLGVDLDDEIETSKNDMRSSVGGILTDYDMSFVKTDESDTSGLDMPSLVSLVTKMRNDTIQEGDEYINAPEERAEGDSTEIKTKAEMLLSNDETLYLFNNFVCYEVKDYHYSDNAELIAHDEFMERMNEFYEIGIQVAFDASDTRFAENVKLLWYYETEDMVISNDQITITGDPHVFVRSDEDSKALLDENGQFRSDIVTVLDDDGDGVISVKEIREHLITYWDVLNGFGIVSRSKAADALVEAGIYEDPTDYRMINVGNLINWKLIEHDIISGNMDTSDVLLDERVSSTLFYDSADWGDFDFEFMRAPIDDWMVVRGMIGLTEKFESMGSSFVQLMPEIITVEMISSLEENLEAEVMPITDSTQTVYNNIRTKDDDGDGQMDGFGYEIYDLPESKGVEEGDFVTRQTNTEKLVDIFEKYGADMGNLFEEETEEGEESKSIRETVKESTDSVFNRLNGKYNVTDPEEYKARTVKDYYGLTDSEEDDGIVIPSLIHYLNANFNSIENMPDNVKDYFTYLMYGGKSGLYVPGMGGKLEPNAIYAEYVEDYNTYLLENQNIDNGYKPGDGGILSDEHIIMQDYNAFIADGGNADEYVLGAGGVLTVSYET